MPMTPQKLKMMLNNKTITQQEYEEMQAKFGFAPKKRGKSIIGFIIVGSFLFILSPFFTFRALPTWGKTIVIASLIVLVMLLAEVFVFKKRMNNKYRVKSAFAEYTLVGGFAGIYFFYAVFTFDWYVNYKEYDYIGVDAYRVLCLLCAAELVLVAVYVFFRIHICRKIFPTVSATIKENGVMLFLVIASILAISSVLVYGTYVNKNTEKKNILDLVNYTYTAETDAVKVDCIFHNNSSAEIQKIDRITVTVKEKNSQKIINVASFRSVAFDEWSIKGKENATLTLSLPYSLQANKSVWEQNKVELYITYSVK